MTERAERVQKVLARAGLGSRRAVEDLIRQGRVRLNGSRVQLGDRCDPARDEVEVDGSKVPLASGSVYYLLNKPAGVVSTTSDPEGRPTVMELLDPDVRAWPVGRLDMDSEGVLIVTNDGDLTMRLTHPRFQVAKRYTAEVEGAFGTSAKKRLERGVELEDGLTAPAKIRIVERVGGRSIVDVTVTEGRNRQVRRMMESVGHPVRRLVRVALGPVTLGRLKPGTFRKLSPEEVRRLYAESKQVEE